ncbi:hypothetical protein [Streptomyces shenzhenensis]|uniref:hypothetical protein n=1 Tax=Streptomyces shenzhenensis TaxID=943815 RepID=UPI00368CBEF6
MRRRAPRRHRRVTGGALLLALPVAAAVVGPLVTPADIPSDGPPYALGGGHPLGTDALGRDVLTLVLRGGASALGVACTAVALAVAVGGLLGLAAAASRSRLLDDLLIRPVELLLPLPSLLVISVVGVDWRGHPVAVALAVAALNVPAAPQRSRGGPHPARPASYDAVVTATALRCLDTLLEQGFGGARQVWCSASDALVAALR